MQANLAAEQEARALRDTELERTRAELAAEQAAAAAAAAEAAESLAAMRSELTAAEAKLSEADAANEKLLADAGQVKKRYLEAQDSVEAEQSAVMRMKVRHTHACTECFLCMSLMSKSIYVSVIMHTCMHACMQPSPTHTCGAAMRACTCCKQASPTCCGHPPLLSSRPDFSIAGAPTRLSCMHAAVPARITPSRTLLCLPVDLFDLAAHLLLVAQRIEAVFSPQWCNRPSSYLYRPSPYLYAVMNLPAVQREISRLDSKLQATEMENTFLREENTMIRRDVDSLSGDLSDTRAALAAAKADAQRQREQSEATLATLTTALDRIQGQVEAVVHAETEAEALRLTASAAAAIDGEGSSSEDAGGVVAAAVGAAQNNKAPVAR